MSRPQEASALDRARMSVPRSQASGAAGGPMAALQYAPGTLGQTVPSPVSRAAGGNPGSFSHSGAGAPSEYHGSGMKPGSYSSAVGGLMAAAHQAPAPDNEDGMDLLAEPKATNMKINRPLAHPLMESPQEDQILFTEMEVSDPASKRVDAERRRYTQLNAAALNYILAAGSRMPADPSDVERPEDVVSRYAFEGVVATEDGKSDLYFDRERGAERAFNCTVRGPENTHNVFGDYLRAGTKLYVIWKKEPILGKVFRLDPRGGSLAFPSANLSTHAVQVSFFGDYRHDKPPMSALRYVDEFGLVRYGIAHRIGTVGNVALMHVDKEDLAKATSDFSAMLAIPKFKMLVSHAG